MDLLAQPTWQADLQMRKCSLINSCNKSKQYNTSKGHTATSGNLLPTTVRLHCLKVVWCMDTGYWTHRGGCKDEERACPVVPQDPCQSYPNLKKENAREGTNIIIKRTALKYWPPQIIAILEYHMRTNCATQRKLLVSQAFPLPFLGTAFWTVKIVKSRIKLPLEIISKGKQVSYWYSKMADILMSHL